MATADSSPYVPLPREFRYGRRYVWQTPVRIAHWTTVASVLTLFFTGLYIANPRLAPAGEPYNNFVMGTVRKVHFAAAYVFLTSFLIRIYCFWFGNNYARSGFPFVWKRQWWEDLISQALQYLKLERGHVHLGHNALAGLAYTVLVIGQGWIQIFTGFAMYSEVNPGGFWDHLVGWVNPLLGGSYRTHMLHHLFAWGFIFFAVIHVYVVLFDSAQWKNGLIGGIINGFKFYEEGDLDHDRWLS
jgi:Ni/Fe-hydrogenase 1 B-type cytochrome subunit